MEAAPAAPVAPPVLAGPEPLARLHQWSWSSGWAPTGSHLKAGLGPHWLPPKGRARPPLALMQRQGWARALSADQQVCSHGVSPCS